MERQLKQNEELEAQNNSKCSDSKKASSSIKTTIDEQNDIINKNSSNIFFKVPSKRHLLPALMSKKC